MANLIEIKNLSVGFYSQGQPKNVVNSISFNISKGKTTALVGESGSGKSVTALSILKLLPYPNAFHESGEIIFEMLNNLFKITLMLIRSLLIKLDASSLPPTPWK